MIYLITALLFFNSAHAQNVVDLGNLEIAGEVRRPMMEYIDSDLKNRKVIVSLLKDEVLTIEAKLTKETILIIEGSEL